MNKKGLTPLEQLIYPGRLGERFLIQSDEHITTVIEIIQLFLEHYESLAKGHPKYIDVLSLLGRVYNLSPPPTYCTAACP